MHLVLRSPPLAESSAARILGSAHPLARALDRRTALHVELLVEALLLVGGCVGLMTGAEAALPLAITAGMVAAGTGARLMFVKAQIHSAVLVLLAEGRDRLPVGEVQEARARLLDVRRRQREARWLRDLADELGRGAPARVPPLISPRVVAAVRAELVAAAADLTSEAPSVASLAVLEQLSYEPWSPLFGQDAQALREALSRVRFLLAS